MKVTIHGTTYTCSKAVRGPDFVRLYDLCGTLIVTCDGISDFAGYSIEGGSWTEFVQAPSMDELAAENKLLHQQVAALTGRGDFQEELIVELANIVYA